jgi:hypothetical protein
LSNCFHQRKIHNWWSNVASVNLERHQMQKTVGGDTEVGFWKGLW